MVDSKAGSCLNRERMDMRQLGSSSRKASPDSLPARLNAEQVSSILGFYPHDIPVLVRHKLLRPLGIPARNGPKYFAACEVMSHSADREWLDRATRAVSSRWQKANAKRSLTRRRTMEHAQGVHEA